jgi:hypothetical protein
MNYIPDSLYAPLSKKEMPFCTDSLNTQYGSVSAPERANGIKCPFGTTESFEKGIFLKESSIITPTPFGRVPQLDPRSLKKIGREWRN